MKFLCSVCVQNYRSYDFEGKKFWLLHAVNSKPFLRELIKEEKMYHYSMHDNATAHTGHYSRSVLENYLANGWYLMDYVLQQLYIWIIVITIVHMNNPHYFPDFQDTIWK